MPPRLITPDAAPKRLTPPGKARILSGFWRKKARFCPRKWQNGTQTGLGRRHHRIETPVGWVICKDWVVRAVRSEPAVHPLNQ